MRCLIKRNLINHDINQSINQSIDQSKWQYNNQYLRVNQESTYTDVHTAQMRITGQLKVHSGSECSHGTFYQCINMNAYVFMYVATLWYNNNVHVRMFIMSYSCFSCTILHQISFSCHHALSL